MFYSQSSFFWREVVRRGLGGKVGLDWKKGRRMRKCFSVEWLKSLDHILCLVYFSWAHSLNTYQLGAKRIEKSFGITIRAVHDLMGRMLLSGDKWETYTDVGD